MDIAVLNLDEPKRIREKIKAWQNANPGRIIKDVKVSIDYLRDWNLNDGSICNQWYEVVVILFYKLDK